MRLDAAERVPGLDERSATELAIFDELLRAMSETLDVATLLPRVSAIVGQLLPHDRLFVTFHSPGGGVVHGSSNDDGPKVDRLRLADDVSVVAGGYRLVGDMRSESLDVVEPPDLQAQLMAAGYRSMLTVSVSSRDQLFGVQFMSKTADAFSGSDLNTARRVAEHLALAVSHEALAQAARRIAEATARAERLEARVTSLSEELDSRAGYGKVVGTSAVWREVLKKATQVAATDTTVLITGESGTGKEVVARFIHRASARKSAPFIGLNCAALPDQLLEAELFGYERGAFTGAQQAKPGQIELASGGVLFLDEIGDMSLAAQAKMLRVLQEREFSRLGATRILKANVRVIAATNHDLLKAMARGDFREDLFYRLHVFDIKLPPLRERPGDILPLSYAFLEEIGRSFGRPPAGLTHDAREALTRRPWPGNARELRNALERAAILCEGGLITSDHLPAAAAPRPATGQSTDLGAMEQQTIAQVMQEVRGNKAQAARRLGLTRTQLYVRLKRYGIA